MATSTSSSTPPRRAKDAAANVLEAAWAAVFAVAGRLARPKFAGLEPTGGRRVLVLAPHPDDEAVGCAGAILLHGRQGDEVRVVCVTDGRASRALGLGPDEMARRRRQEAEAAAGILGLTDLIWLGLPEGNWAVEQLSARLMALLAEHEPHLIYAPSRVDFHPEHFKTAHALAAALTATPGSTIHVYPIQTPLTSALANRVVGLGEVLPRSAESLRAYVTQWDSVARALRLKRYTAAFYGLPGQAEEFWEMTPETYVRLHSSSPVGWPSDQFRSLRPRPWTDPLAYWRGQGARRRLAAQANP